MCVMSIRDSVCQYEPDLWADYSNLPGQRRSKSIGSTRLARWKISGGKHPDLQFFDLRGMTLGVA